MHRIVLLLLCLIAPSLSWGTPYFLEQITASPEVASAAEKIAVAQSVVGRVRTLCGDSLTASEQDATERVRLHFLRLKKVGGASRFLIGPFRGNSIVTIDVIVLDKAGKEVRRQAVSRRGNWFLGSVTVGGTDNRMLTNVASDVCVALRGTISTPAYTMQSDAVVIESPQPQAQEIPAEDSEPKSVTGPP